MNTVVSCEETKCSNNKYNVCQLSIIKITSSGCADYRFTPKSFVPKGGVEKCVNDYNCMKLKEPKCCFQCNDLSTCQSKRCSCTFPKTNHVREKACWDK